MSRPKQYLCFAIVTIVLFAGSHAVQAQTTLIDTFRDWASYEHNGKSQKICFALSKPLKTIPQNIKRDAAFIYVSAWPKDGVKAEVSVKLGFPLKQDSIATIKVGSESYRLIVEDDKAFVDDATAELKLLEAMKRGSKLTIEVLSADGKTVRDTYSLRGVTKAIQSLSTTCP